jgi:hypothetical protein
MGTTIFGISKTTINGWLAGLIGVSLALQIIQIPTDLATPDVLHVWHWILFVITILASMARVVVGILQGDASYKKAIK